MKTKDHSVRVPVRDKKVSEKRDESIGLDGVWPRVNRELIRDYPRGSESHGVFRIHLDIPISKKATFEELETAFATGNLDTAREVLRKEVGKISPGTDAHHAWRTVEAALRANNSASPERS